MFPSKLIIEVNDLTPDWLDKMKQAYKEATLEIHIHEAPVVEKMTEEAFWAIIALLDWNKGEDDDAILAPARQRLQQYSVGDIRRFQDILAEKLYQLDRQVFAEQIGEYRYGGPHNFSVDTFLYARACVVANGKAFYEVVLSDPSKMPKEFTFEALLYLAGEAYEQKTGEQWDYLPKLSYETFTNREGWGGKSWLAGRGSLPTSY
ncbi:MAG: DUF4240 domain-containing protein [Lewinellaceae bacterium]|nr:DUF4240 domain-containing protein [Lewinellaceae bacterium]